MSTQTAEHAERWQVDGVHWHLFEEEHHPESKERFVGLTAQRLERRELGVAYAPEEATEWMGDRERELWDKTPEPVQAGQKFAEPGIWDWLAEARQRSLRAGKGVGGGVKVAQGRVVDLWAVEMPLAECPRHR